MVEIKVGDIVRLKDNEDDQKYAERFNLTGELEVSSIKDSIVLFKGKMLDSSIRRLELVKEASTNPFIKTETETIVKEVKKFNGDETTFGKLTLWGSCFHVCISSGYSSISVEIEEIDSLIKHLRLYKEALQEVSAQ